jgi:Fe-Mn family superoxide dismutase
VGPLLFRADADNPGLAPIKLKWDNDKLHMTDLLALSAREPSLALAFNYAALLLNNSYFLEGLNADAAKPVPDHFQALEDRVAAYAEGIVGSGWLWIVKAGDGATDLDVVPTYGAGTLLVTMRQQRGRQDTLPVFGTPSTSGDTAPAPAAEEPSSDGLPPRHNPAATPGRRAGSEATPLAVLNLFEHAYLGDKYGVFSRGQYARDWFRSLDWDKVSKRTASTQSW